MTHADHTSLSRQASTSHTARFISFEGTEGVGKTTAIDGFCAELQRLGIDFVRTREPGGSVVAERIREIFLDPAMQMCDDTELLLMYAARADHCQKVIMPALAAGKWVVCDRFVDSTVAYQGFGRFGGDASVLQKIDALTQAFVPVLPDTTIWLDLDVELGLVRAGRRGAADRLEAQALDFFGRVYQGLLYQYSQHSQRVIRLDASGDAKMVLQRIWAAVFGDDGFVGIE